MSTILRQVVAEVLEISEVALVKENSDCHGHTQIQASMFSGVVIFLDEHCLPSGFKRKAEIIDLTEQTYQ